MADKRLNFIFDDDDVEVLEKVMKLLREKQGKVSASSAIRIVLREYVAAAESSGASAVREGAQ